MCQCDARRIPTQCKASAQRMGVSVSVLVLILGCIVVIIGEIRFSFFLFLFAGLLSKVETVSLFWKSKRNNKCCPPTGPVFAQPRQSSSRRSASVLKLLSSEKEDLFLLNLCICSNRCLLRKIKSLNAAEDERVSVERKHQKKTH